MNFDFSENVAFIFGGAGGIPAEIAMSLGKRGAELCLFDINLEALERTSNKLEKEHIKVKTYVTDLTDEESIKKSVDKAMNESGKVDILINGASVITRKPIFDLSPHEWNKTLAINLTGTYLTCRLVGKIMAQRGYGRIMNFTSQNSSGARNNADYAVSKAGIESLTRSLAVELRELDVDVTVNAISPPPTITELWKRGRSEDQINTALEQKTVFETGEMTRVILFLCSKESGSISGNILTHKHNLFRVPNR